MKVNVALETAGVVELVLELVLPSLRRQDSELVYFEFDQLAALSQQSHPLFQRPRRGPVPHYSHSNRLFDIFVVSPSLCASAALLILLNTPSSSRRPTQQVLSDPKNGVYLNRNLKKSLYALFLFESLDLGDDLGSF